MEYNIFKTFSNHVSPVTQDSDYCDDYPHCKQCPAIEYCGWLEDSGLKEKMIASLKL